MRGIVEGGWEFVVAAYVVTAALLGAYAASIFLRFTTEKRRNAARVAEESRK